MSLLAEFLLRPAAIISILAALTLFISKAYRANPEYPKGVQWVGYDPKKWFADSRAMILALKSAYDLAAEGYHTYNKNGKSYLLLDASMGGTEMLLPRSQWQWVLDQPDDILSTSEPHFDTLGSDYSFTHRQILRDPYHEHVIHKYLPRRLPTLIPDLQEEVAVGFEDSWGSDTEQWKEIRLYDSVMFMISRAVNRMIVGMPLCRNEEFLENTRSFAMAIIGSGLFIGHTPDWLKPIVGRMVTLPNQWYYRKTSKHTIPLIKERKANFERKKQDPSFQWEPPNDFISWSIMLADAENRQDEGSVDRISRRIMPIEFAAIHTSALSITQCLFDLIASDPSRLYLETIRQEAVVALSGKKWQWNKSNLAQCHYADSALRESMRLNNFMSRNVIRKVLPETGITNPIEGWHAPKGTYLAFDMHNVQHDPEVYQDPDDYQAFRFVPAKESKSHESTLSDKNNSNSAEVTPASTGNTSLATTSEIWFPFSRGRHTCPGRFFIAAEIKVLLAYMTMHYDIEPLAKRPDNVNIGQAVVPSSTATIRVRRRKQPKV